MLAEFCGDLAASWTTRSPPTRSTSPSSRPACGRPSNGASPATPPGEVGDPAIDAEVPAELAPPTPSGPPGVPPSGSADPCRPTPRAPQARWRASTSCWSRSGPVPTAPTVGLDQFLDAQSEPTARGCGPAPPTSPPRPCTLVADPRLGPHVAQAAEGLRFPRDHPVWAAVAGPPATSGSRRRRRHRRRPSAPGRRRRGSGGPAETALTRTESTTGVRSRTTSRGRRRSTTKPATATPS